MSLVLAEPRGLELLAELARTGAITRTGLYLDDPALPYERFEAVCALLGQWHESIRFALGDAILLGEALYGEQAYQAIESLGLSEEGRREYARVSERVARSRRRKDLSWSHHRAVAALSPVEQKAWLRRAAEKDLSHHALREELREGEPPAALTHCRCCGREL